MVVTVEISSLVLTGLPVRDTAAFVAAFEAELARLMASGAVPRHRRVVRGTPLPASGSPARLGRALARSVHDGLMS